MTDRAWFDAAKGDIPQWAASMPKDADGTTIDWDWVRSLDLAHGVGTIPESTPQSIHDALKADYATRERLESIIAQCNSAFMTDFDRFIGSYRLPRALAYANRRLNDNINTLLHLGEQQHLWAVSRERRGGVPMFLSTPWGVDVSGFRLAVVGALRPAGGVRRPFPCGPVQATRAGSW